METADAVNHLMKELDTDPGYRISWRANIAVQFQDSWQRAVDAGGLPSTPRQIHEISNEAAENFLKLLCSQRDDTSHQGTKP